MDRIPLSDEAPDPTDDRTDDQFDTPEEVELAFDRYLVELTVGDETVTPDEYLEQRDDELTEDEETLERGRELSDLEAE